jgi:hypothetical protein
LADIFHASLQRSQTVYTVQLGFTESHDVQGRLSIADLFLKSKKRYGIYLLEFDDGLYYIGQAVDVVRRFTQHRKNYTNIARLSFQATHRPNLDAQEQLLIHQAESLGVPLINKIYTSYVAGETDLDLLISPDEQEAWLADPALFADDTMRIHAYLDETSRIKYKYTFQKFQADPRFQPIVELLQQYIVACIPAYRFYGSSCGTDVRYGAWVLQLTAFEGDRWFFEGFLCRAPRQQLKPKAFGAKFTCDATWLSGDWREWER